MPDDAKALPSPEDLKGKVVIKVHNLIFFLIYLLVIQNKYLLDHYSA